MTYLNLQLQAIRYCAPSIGTGDKRERWCVQELVARTVDCVQAPFRSRRRAFMREASGCFKPDHKRLCTAEKGKKDGIPGFIRMWRSSDKWAKTNELEGFLPN